MATQPNPAKRFIPIAIIIVLIGALGYVNKSLTHSSVKTNDEGEEQPDPDAEKAKPAKPASPPVAANQTKDVLQPEVIINDPTKAKTKIVVGWQYDANTQVHPENLIKIVQAIQQIAASSNGTISAQIVDVDVPTEELSPASQSVTDLGIAINGLTTVTVNGQALDLGDNPGQGLVTLPTVQAALATPSPPK